MEKIKNPYMHIVLSTDTESEPEEVQQPIAIKEGKRYKKVEKAKKLVSAVSKKYEALFNIEKSIKGKVAEKDFSGVFGEFETLNRELGKMQHIIDVEGTPVVYLRILHELNTIVQDDEAVSDLNKENSASLKKLKQRLKKVHSTYEDEIKAAEESGELFKEEEKEEVELVTDYGTTEESEDEEMDFEKRLTLSKEERRKFWMVKEKDKKAVKKKDRTKKVGKKKPKIFKKFLHEEEEFEKFDTSDKSVMTKLETIYAAKASFKEAETARTSRFLAYVTRKLSSDIRKAETLFLLINLNFEEIKFTGIAECDLWDNLLTNIKRLFKLLKVDDLELRNYYSADELTYKRADLLSLFATIVNKFDVETSYGLKLSDPFNMDYVRRLNQELKLVDFLQSMRTFFEEDEDVRNKNKLLSDISFAELQHIYHMSNDLVINSDLISKLFGEVSIEARVKELVSFITDNCKDEPTCYKARLFGIFNAILNGKELNTAKNSLLELLTIPTVRNDKDAISCFNRCLLLLGTSFFAVGDFLATKECLFELLNSRNVENLLAQYDPNSTNVLDTIDPLTVMPYHMHLNIEEAETCFLIASIVTESHATVIDSDAGRTNSLNKKLRSFLSKYESTFFVNSVDSTSDCIFMVFREILRCNVARASEYISKIGYLTDKEHCLTALKKNIKTECFNVYVEKLKNEQRTSFNINDLGNIFQLPVDELKKVIRGKISRGQLSGVWDKSEEIFFVNNALNEFYNTEEEIGLLTSLKSVYGFNERVKEKLNEGADGRDLMNQFGLFKMGDGEKRSDEFRFVVEAQLYRKTMSN